MKFAKDLEREAVPEWRMKYLNYKAGKKYIKAVSRAIARANTPSGTIPLRATTFLAPLTPRTPATKPKNSDRDTAKPTEGNGLSTGPGAPSTPAITKPTYSSRENENESLTNSSDNRHYGSFTNTPEGQDVITRQATIEELDLPDPAMRVQSNAQSSYKGSSRPNQRRSLSMNVTPKGAILKRPTPAAEESPGHLRRLFTNHSTARGDSRHDGDGYNLEVVREREQEFFSFLDSELDKVETFYRMK